jgi:hypothetical protein
VAVSDYPATLGDLTDVEERIDARLTRVEKRQAADAEVTDEKVSDLRDKVIEAAEAAEASEATLREVLARLFELERLWAVALENPDLIRELAAQALKARGRD